VDHALIATVMLASWIAAAAPPAHLRALAPDAFDARGADRIPAPAALPAGPGGALPDLQWPLQPTPGVDAFGYHGTG
jgi:hypothetical protein